MHVAVVGGGIAGLAASYHLLRAGVRDVVLYEREPTAFAHSSGRNAAIYRPLDLDHSVSALVSRSAELLDELMGSRSSWLEAAGLLLVAKDMRFLEPLLATAERLKLDVATLQKPELGNRAPFLKDGEVEYALEIPGAGVLNTHPIATELMHAFRARGGTFRAGVEVLRLDQAEGHVTSLMLSTGETIACDAAVIAAGAWSNQVGATAGAWSPLTPHRWHLALLALDVPRTMTMIWDIKREFYFRAESRGLLASPGDADAVQSLAYGTDPHALEVLYDKARHVARLVARASVRRFWACFRTFAPDRLPVIGEDRKVRGVFWLAGLGGFGMSAGLAAGEVLARAVLGRSEADDEAFSPARFDRELAHR